MFHSPVATPFLTNRICAVADRLKQAQHATVHKSQSEGHHAWLRGIAVGTDEGLAMLEQFRSDAIHDCYRRAAEARRIADTATNSDAKSDFLEFERRWLALAGGFSSEGFANNGESHAGGRP
jgi:hypothetical protein